jgi:hypothetical protein
MVDLREFVRESNAIEDDPDDVPESFEEFVGDGD